MADTDLNLIRRDLTREITGRILGPGDQGYSDSISIDNGRVSLKPYLVAKPASTEDVSKIVKYCHDKETPMTVKAGGHSAAGYCLNAEGILLDLGDMNAINFLNDGTELSIGAGARWISVYDFLRDRQSPYTVIGGACAGVGVAGFTLGGGYSFISRSYGLGCDNVERMEFVSTCGNVFELGKELFKNNNLDEDKRNLFRALRGAGGGNFGVVTRINLKLRKTHVPRPTMGQVTFPFYRIDEILPFYNDWVTKLPKAMAVYGMMRNFPNQRLGGKPTLALRFTPVFNGPFCEAIELLKPLLQLAPDDVAFYTMTLPEWENFVGTNTQVKGRSAYIRSLVLGAGTLNSKVVQICKAYMARATSPDSYVVWTHTGGEISNPEYSKSSSYAHRDGAFTFEVKSQWDSAQPLMARPNIEWAVEFFDALGEHAQGAYINYIDPLLLDWKRQYYRNEHDNLRKIQDRWNKDRWFKFQQSIDSNYETPSRKKPLDLSPLSRTIFVE